MSRPSSRSTLYRLIQAGQLAHRAVLLPLSEVLAVIFLHEKFDGTTGIALVLSLWGFASYLYGEKAQKKLEAQKSEHLVAKKTGDLELAAP